MITRKLWVLLLLATSALNLAAQNLLEALKSGESWEVEWIQQRHLRHDEYRAGSHPLFPDQLKAGAYDMRIGIRLSPSPKQELTARITYISYIEFPPLEQMGTSSSTAPLLSQPIILDTRFQDAYFDPQLFFFNALLQHDFPMTCRTEAINNSLSDFSEKVDQFAAAAGLVESQMEWLQRTELHEAFSPVSLSQFFCQVLQQDLPEWQRPLQLTTRQTESHSYENYLQVNLPSRICVLQGQILNQATKEVRIKFFRQGDWHSYWQDSLIQLDKDGYFALNFPLAERRIISIAHGYQTMRFYIEPGDTLSFQTDANAFYREMSLVGTAVPENQFLLDFYHQMRGDTLFRRYDYQLGKKEPIAYFKKIQAKEQAELAFLNNRKTTLRPQMADYIDRSIRLDHATIQWEACYRYSIEEKIILPNELIQRLQRLGNLLHRLPKGKTFDFDVEDYLNFQYSLLTQSYEKSTLNSKQEMHLSQVLLSKETFVRHTAMQLFRMHGQLGELTKSGQSRLQEILSITRDTQLIDELLAFTKENPDRSPAVGHRMIPEGKPAPNWSYGNQEGVKVSLEDFQGKQLLLHIGWDDLLDLAEVDLEPLKERSEVIPTVVHLITARSKEQFSKSIAGREGLFIYVPEEEMTTLRENYRVDNRTNHYFLIGEDGNVLANHLALGTARKLRGTWQKLAQQAVPAVWTPEQRLQFWQSLGIGALGLLAIASLILWQRRLSMRRDLRRRQMLEVELRGIRSQMNPHFLFNAMSSIQNLIRKKEQEKADIYLGQFAGLMRKTLRNTAAEYIPLSDEIETLEQYCSLESLRHPFAYSFVIDESIDPHNTYIPSMILQPIIENAILHGLTPLAAARELRVSISPGTLGLHCEIIDNGIGLLATQRQLQSDQRKSYGTKLVRQRLDLLGMDSEQHFVIQDRSQLDPPSRGTLVTLIIPTEQ